MTEGKPIRLCGLIVEHDSSDPGLLSRPIQIDANHITICKPIGRTSEIYVHVRDFLTRRLDAAHRETAIEGMLKSQETQLKTLMDVTQEGNSQLSQTIVDQGEKTADIVADRLRKDIDQIASSVRKYPKELVDNEIQKNYQFCVEPGSLQDFLLRSTQ